MNLTQLLIFCFLYRYCNQVLCKEIDECVTLLLQELVSFQERIYQKDPVRAKARRRLVMGLREVTKHMKLNKIKCVIISPNCEKIQSKGMCILFLRCLIFIWSKFDRAF
jgi:hypothetical protein